MDNLPLELIDGTLKYLTFDEQTACYWASKGFHALSGRYILDAFLYRLDGIEFDIWSNYRFGDGFGKPLANGWYNAILKQEGINFYDHNFDGFKQDDKQKVISIISDNMAHFCKTIIDGSQITCTRPHQSCKRCKSVICRETEIKLQCVLKFVGIIRKRSYGDTKSRQYKNLFDTAWNGAGYRGIPGVQYDSMLEDTYTVNWDYENPKQVCHCCDLKRSPLCLTCTYGIPQTINEVKNTKNGKRLLVKYVSVLPYCRECDKGYCESCVRLCSFCAKIMCISTDCDKFKGISNWQCRSCDLEKFVCSNCQPTNLIQMCGPCLNDKIRVLH